MNAAAARKSYAAGPAVIATPTIGTPASIAVSSSSRHHGRLSTSDDWMSTRTSDARTWSASWRKSLRSSESRKQRRPSDASSSACSSRASDAH